MLFSLWIYNWEHIERGIFWYIFFFSVVIFLILFSFFKWWIMWWISVIFIFLIIIVWYIILYLSSLKKTNLELYNWYFIINNKTYSFNELLWFNVGLNNKWDFTYFAIIPQNTWYPIKYTINDNQENTKKLIEKLIELWLPIYAEYENDKMYKLITRLKLW